MRDQVFWCFVELPVSEVFSESGDCFLLILLLEFVPSLARHRSSLLIWVGIVPFYELRSLDEFLSFRSLSRDGLRSVE